MCAGQGSVYPHASSNQFTDLLISFLMKITVAQYPSECPDDDPLMMIGI